MRTQSYPSPSPFSSSPPHCRRHTLHGDAAAALLDLLRCLEVECQAVRAAVAGGKQALVGGKGAAAKEAAEALLAASQARSPTCCLKRCSLFLHRLLCESATPFTPPARALTCHASHPLWMQELKQQLVEDSSIVPTCLATLHVEVWHEPHTSILGMSFLGLVFLATAYMSSCLSWARGWYRA